MATLRAPMIPRNTGTLIAATMIALLGGTAVAAAPLAGLGVALAIPAGALLVAKASARLTVVVVGALLVFQGVGNGGKVVYFILALACCALSGIRLARSRDPIAACFKPMLYSGLVFAAALIVSVFVARSAGTSTLAWFRDALPYILLLVLPVVGVDAGRDLSPRHTDQLIAGIGIFAAVGFAVEWLDRRGASTLGIGRLILATGLLTAMAFTYALGHADRGRRAVKWLIVATVILALLLVTGTRSVAVFALGFVGVIGRKRKASINPIRLAAYFAAVLLLIMVVVPFMAHYLINDPNFLHSKVQNTINVATGRAGDDQSYQAREYAYSLNKGLFDTHPWLGTGPGYIGSLDSPWVVPAKIGIVGVGALLVYVAGIGWSLRKTWRLSGPLPIHAAGRGWLFILIGSSPLGPTPEDKGLALALTLFVAATCTKVAEAGTTTSTHRDLSPRVAANRGRLPKMILGMWT